MRAVVLVGGFGTRLRPLTLSTPKQMLLVVNLPMVERVLAHLAHHGVDDAVLSLGYRPDAFVASYPDGRCAGVRLHYAVEPEPRDTAGAIRFAADHAGIAERFLVVNGDILTDLDLGKLIKFHDRNGAEGTIALHRVDDPSAFGVVPTDHDGRVDSFIEKPPRDEAPTDLINAGTYVLEPSVLDRIPEGEPVNIERVTFPAMAADRSLYALDGETYWIDAGTPSTYLQANLDRLDGKGGAAEPGVAPDAKVAGEVSRSAVGAGAYIAAGATVRGSVVLPGATIGSGALVTDSVVGPDARIEQNARVTGGSVLGDSVTVSAGSEVDGRRLPESVP